MAYGERIDCGQATKEDFDNLRHPQKGLQKVEAVIVKHAVEIAAQRQFILNISQEQSLATGDLETVYPSAGIIHTDFDNLGELEARMLPEDIIDKTLAMRTFFIMMSNHPYRLEALRKVNNEPFKPPQKVYGTVFESANNQSTALAIGDLAAGITGGDREERISRSEIYATGLYVQLGRQARIPLVGSESPDVWNSSMAVATMAASHALCSIPRNGVLSDIERQTAFAREVFTHLEDIAAIVLDGRPDNQEILQMWKNNVVGTLEPTLEKAMKRANALYSAGVRGFRIYSPEPGNAIVHTTSEIKRHFGDETELITGQVVDVEQAKRVCDAGANVIVIGVAGGGRCITGVRSGTAVDWPELIWNLRGEINIPIVVQGGASDHVATTLLLGASGIGVSRIVAGGTIESPGGALYLVDDQGKLFKPYGGEASARNKQLDGKILPFGIPAFVEGETTRAYINFFENALPTLTYNLHRLLEDATLALVFRGSSNIYELHAINPSPLKIITPAGNFQQSAH